MLPIDEFFTVMSYAKLVKASFIAANEVGVWINGKHW